MARGKSRNGARSHPWDDVALVVDWPARSRHRRRALAWPPWGFALLLLALLLCGPVPTPAQVQPPIPAARAPTNAVERGPYVQSTTPTSAILRWRTQNPSASRVHYGSNWGNLQTTGTLVLDLPLKTEHIVEITGLAPGTRYYYTVGGVLELLAGNDPEHYFETHPVPGQPQSTHIWVLGDSGFTGPGQQAVRDSYYAYTGDRHTDLWLHVGDLSQSQGTDSQYQQELFDVYPEMLRQTAIWPTVGNHDSVNSSSSSLSGPYFESFSLPANGEAGGLPSGTEAYYSLDFGNIHIVVLNSEDVERSVGGEMLTWLELDLASTDKDWIFAVWHHPPYSKGHHDSDDPADSGGRSFDMRENALPILQDYGVDLVLTGHSHSYERSFLLEGHYGTSDTLTEEMKVDPGDGREDGDGPYMKPVRDTEPPTGPGDGAVFTVTGSGSASWGAPLDHPVMVSALNVLGSMVLDVDGRRLVARFLDSSCTGADCTQSVRDRFTLIKGSECPGESDADYDGVCDDVDNCVDDFNPQQEDLDEDGSGDLCDPCPEDPDDDLDQDGICGNEDNCPDEPNSGQEDQDGDGLGDACDDCFLDPQNDADLDGACANEDNCPEVSNGDQADSDDDGVGDACDPCPFDETDDVDLDGVCGLADNCPDVANTHQGDSDADGQGDACDPCPGDPVDDQDGDGICGESDNCPGVANAGQGDADGDGAGDPCDACPVDADNDFDGDGHCENADNCPGAYNTSQEDTDGDGIGDACDHPDDTDGDSVIDGVDNCPSSVNPGQQDRDGDGIGDACDADDDDDGVTDEQDCAPLSPGVSATAGPIGPTLKLGEFGGSNLRWARAEQGHISHVYRAITDVGMPFAPEFSCVELGLLETSTLQPELPPPGTLYLYLVGAANACGAGPLAALGGAAREPSSLCPATAADDDGDGVPDLEDNCPSAYDLTLSDVDGDFVGDVCDNCIDRANWDQRDADGDGVGDVCVDWDLDGVADTDDNCPQAANADQVDADEDGAGDACDDCPDDASKLEPGLCGCGVGDVDSDGDQTPDCDDGCPDDASKLEPGLCGCGVGDVDSDGDQTPDCDDDCPNDPEKQEPGSCGCGVVETDEDEDATPDCLDNCPLDANPAQLDTDDDGAGNACDEDDDGDEVPDGEDWAPLDATACRDEDGDGCDDCTSGVDDPANDGDDNEGDGLCDLGDPDDDNDAVADEDDSAPLDNTQCRDADEDRCDDCTSGVDDPANDGDDNEGDGLCDLGDPDDDNDAVADEDDSAPLDNTQCRDADEDQCDDCTGGVDDPVNDGDDHEGDGLCDLGDPDDDNDAVADEDDAAPLDATQCRDADEDQCDDCTSGVDDPADDGADNEGDGLCDLGDPDDDNDAVADEDDAAPLDATQCRDADEDQCDDCTSGVDDPANDGDDHEGDGLCDLGDPDDDNDAVADEDDAAPLDATQCRDADEDQCDDCTSGVDDPADDGADNEGDGLCDLGDPDDDNDAVVDPDDSAPFDNSQCRDADEDQCDDCTSGVDDPANDGDDHEGDGLCDLGDPDDDNDAVADPDDSAPFDNTQCRDADGDQCDDCTSGVDDPANDGDDNEGDGLCDLGDPDDDNDAVADEDDAVPLDATQCRDADEDQCDDCTSGVDDPANDGDDHEGDGLCDLGDPDDDNDAVADEDDSAPFDNTQCRDADEDQCDDCSSGSDNPDNDGPDADLDGVCNLGDNCPGTPNPDQLNTDGDGQGNACDADDDDDGEVDLRDNCPLIVNPDQADGDGDEIGDLCDPCLDDPFNDRDGDGLCTEDDNCPAQPNSDQGDADGDGIGDVCEMVSVAGLYRISATEVTNAEYAVFLNAVAFSDPNKLFHSAMQSDPQGGIRRDGSAGSWSYTTRPNMANKPVNFVGWLDAARYANWRHNGQPTGVQGPATTETGAYDLTGVEPGIFAQREPGALWYLPNTSQWELAAYYRAGPSQHYLYPTQSDRAPDVATATANGDVANPGRNVANYDLGAVWNGEVGNATSVASAGRRSTSWWGTYDQGGNVAEWTENSQDEGRTICGGSFDDGVAELRFGSCYVTDESVESATTGFRVAQEPR